MAEGQDPRYLTGDRPPVMVMDGMSVWTNDLDLVWIDFKLTNPEGEYWDGWWTARNHHGGTSLVNRERMAVRHPVTRMRAPDMRTLTDRQWREKVARGFAVTSAAVDSATVADVKAANPDWDGEHWCWIDGERTVPCNVLPPVN